MKEITVVGCGVMGSSLINALMNAGLHVNIVDLDKKNAKPFIARGASYAPELDKAADTDCILLNLPTHTIAKKVILSADKEKLNGRMLINTTTSTPSEVKDMDKTAAELGMLHLDAKLEVYPGDIGTENGYIVYSGSRDVFIKAENALKALGKAVFLGENVVGASVTDIAVLEVHFGAIAALAEASTFCIKNNYSVKKFVEQTREILPIMLEGNLRAFGDELENWKGKFEDASECSLDIEYTALSTILRAMNDDGVKTPCGNKTLELFDSGRKAGNGKKNVVAVVNELI